MSDKKGLKEFKLTTLSVRNSTTVFVLTVIIFISGLVAYMQMPRESFPEVDVPTIFIGVAYPGNSPLEIEKLITRPIEKELNTISGVDEIISNSIQGYASIQVKFDFSVTIDQALQKVKDAVDKAKSDPSFPDDLPAEPNIFEMNFTELMPVMNINLSGDFSLEMLQEYAEYLEDKIEQLSEISKVEIRGIQEKEVKIILDAQKMEAMNISFRDIENAISQENMSVSGGEILIDGIRRSVNTQGEFKDWREIGNIIVKRQRGNIVYLRDIAKVKFEEKEKESYAREFTNPVVMLDIFKRSGENLIIASEKINEIIRQAQKNYFPENLTITITNDQSSRTKKQVSDLENSIIFGMLLVIAVLMFFLGLRNALFVGIAIPMSMFLSFMILGAMGITLNFMVLFALILALGMLVDNGIVIVENVYRLMSEGYSKRKAAIYGAGEVAWPIISSTATTLAAFLPLAIWPGIIGKFMKFLPITLIIVLSSSLFVALVINPVFTSVFMKIEQEKPHKRKTLIISFGLMIIGLLMHFTQILTLGHLLLFAGILGMLNLFIFLPVTDIFQQKILPALENIYERFLSFALSGKQPFIFLIGTFLLLIFSFFLVVKFTPKINFFPINQPQYLNIFIELPIGTDIEETNRFTQNIESKLMDFFNEEIEWNGEQLKRGFIVESMIAQVGKGTSDPSRGPSMGNTPHKARIAVSFVPFEERKGMNTADVMRQVSKLLEGIPGATITVSKNEMGPPTGKPISIELSGENYDVLLSDAEKLKQLIESYHIPGIEKLTFDIDENKPELIIEVDRQKARRYMLSTAQIGAEIRTALYGKEVSRYKEGEDDYKIMVRLDDETRYDVEKLLNKKITFRNQMTGKIHQIPISAVAKPMKRSTLGTVKRIDLKRVVTLQSNVLEGYNANEIVQAIKQRIKNFPLSEGTKLRFSGQQEQQAKEMAFLSKALMIAVFIIFLIIVAQFNSVSAPFIIVTSVIFSLIGVLLGLVIFQMDFIVIMTMIGIISLAGVVVNNAIVLIDYTNLIIERKRLELGLKEEEKLPYIEIVKAIIQGGKTRLRPVLLTAITTILGLLPLATGMNINFISLITHLDPQIYFGGESVMFWGPMSWTVIFGLSFATFLTLVVVPVMYLIAARIKLKFGGVI